MYLQYVLDIFFELSTLHDVELVYDYIEDYTSDEKVIVLGPNQEY